jgi:hypothetical protein
MVEHDYEDVLLLFARGNKDACFSQKEGLVGAVIVTRTGIRSYRKIPR